MECLGAKNLDMLMATAIKATSGFVGHGSEVELERIYRSILDVSTPIYLCRHRLEMQKHIKQLMNSSTDLGTIDNILVDKVVEAVFETIAKMDNGDEYFKLLGNIHNQAFQLSIPRYLDDRRVAEKLYEKEFLIALARLEQQQRLAEMFGVKPRPLPPPFQPYSLSHSDPREKHH